MEHKLTLFNRLILDDMKREAIKEILVMLGYLEFIRKHAAEEYIKGSITLSKAAEKAQFTLWEMERYLVEKGFKSDYPIEDLEKEFELLS